MAADDSTKARRTSGPIDLQQILDSLAMPCEGSGSESESGENSGTPRQSRKIPSTAPSVSALDVAEYILRKLGQMSTMKLQKLVYYAQAWSLVWDESPLFKEDIQAWANGPVIRELFNYHRGMFEIEHVFTGNPGLLSPSQKDTVDAVLDFYGNRPAQWLIDLSHSEAPWKTARKGMPETARGTRNISLESMAEYYSSLADDN